MTGSENAEMATTAIGSAHPYFISTVTPSGGIIVNMHWPNKSPEPHAFTNAADFSAWLKVMIDEHTHQIPKGIRPLYQDKTEEFRQRHIPRSETEYDNETTTPKRAGVTLGSLLRGRN
jgi:hypothetical protein